MSMPLRVLCLTGLTLLTTPTSALGAGDTAEPGVLVTKLSTEGSGNHSAIPGGPLLAESCSLTWEETEAERQERDDRKAGKDLSKSHYAFSLLKICYYDCLGEEASMEISAAQPCPPTIR